VRKYLTFTGKGFPYRAIVMITSKITSKAQTTIPRSVRTALHLTEGDAIAYRIEGDRAVITRARSNVAENPFAAFSEWTGTADRQAYAEL
jgi:antitoxin PrlF